MANWGDGANMVWADLLGVVGTDQLHGDLLIQILVRLPVLSILRFKSVCRAWCILFNSAIFIQHHCRMMCSFTKMANLSSWLVHTESYKGNAHIFSLLIDRSCGNPIMKKFKPPFGGGLYHVKVKVLGSINGLVCLSLCANGTVLVLWNPATRKQRQIPHPQLLLDSSERALLGFAYDEITDSYKVLRILETCIAEANLRARVEIYSTGTNVWRATEIPGFPWLMDTNRCGNPVGCVPYWLAVDMKSNLQELFVWFDASTEAFGFHPIASDDTDDDWTVDLDVMGDDPVAVYYEPRIMVDDMDWKVSSLDIRKLKKCKDGDKDSFGIEKLTIEPVPHLTTIVGFRGSDEIIALDQHKHLLIYDHRSTQTKYLPSYGNWGLPEVYNYNETLVWPSSLA